MSVYSTAVRDPRVREYLVPKRVLSSEGAARAEWLLSGPRLISYVEVTDEECTLIAPGGHVLLDFGIELHGGVRIVTGQKRDPSKHHYTLPPDWVSESRIRIRFGESASEAMGTPNQDHTIHDEVLHLPMMGVLEYGSTGFRFVRIDNVGNVPVPLHGVSAVALYRDFVRIGAFECSDERLNRIWNTALYTVQLCMQEYLFDGAKRDRLVWLGDMHPESKVILSIAQDPSILRESLDFAEERTPLPHYMNTMLSYSCWWLINQYEYYLFRGDLKYLRAKRPYILGLLHHFAEMIQEDGTIDTHGRPIFTDWPSSVNPEAQRAGGQGLFAWMFRDTALLCDALGEPQDAALARDALVKVRRHVPNCGTFKSAAAMQTLSGLADRSDVLLQNPLQGLSTFYGYYMLLAQPVPNALNVLRNYWGAMLDRGATTFWEDFHLEWLDGSGRIDELPVPGQKDLHADFGDFCYKGLRHSLCHGWAGGPAAYLIEAALGLKPAAPGCAKVSFQPQLGDLQWARGALATPFGPVTVEIDAKGRRDISLPPGVSLV